MIQILIGSGAASALPSTTYPNNFPLKIGSLETREGGRPQSFGPRDCEARLLPPERGGGGVSPDLPCPPGSPGMA